MKTHNDYAKRFGLNVIPADDLTIERQEGDDEGWDYVRTQGTVSSSRRRAIDALAIPPAWQEVRIATDPQAHLQAIGRDGGGRLQYLYHPDWHRVREAVKADRLLRFGRALPTIRKKVDEDLRLPPNRARSVLATLVRLIDRQSIRIGNEQYVKQGTRGATTLRTDHVTVDGDDVKIDYTGKSGKEIALSISDRNLKKRLIALKRRNRGRLFKANRKDGQKKPIRASRLNAYLTKCAGVPVSAKDFRTFHASSKALAEFCAADATNKSKLIAQTAERVSRDLRNTPTVARSSYIHPSIIEAYESDELNDKLIKGRKREGLSREETALMRFLESTLTA